jgi:hypothetical protein
LIVRRRCAALGILAIVATSLAAFGSVGGVAAAGDTMRLEPASQAVAKGDSFTVRVVQSASVPTGGAQASVTFDPSKVTVTSLTRGAPHAGAAIFVPSDLAAAIGAANQAGTLVTIATAFLPPASVPPGDADFLVITFTAVGCGRSDLGLPAGPIDAVLLDGRPDTYGNGLPVTTTGGSVDVLCDGATAAPPPGEVAGATAAPAGPGTSADLAPTAGPTPIASAPAAAGSDGGPPWVVIGLAAVVVVVAAGGLLLLQRSRNG